ncbi:MFS transporter [Kribbella sp. CWNU-51]
MPPCWSSARWLRCSTARSSPSRSTPSAPTWPRRCPRSTVSTAYLLALAIAIPITGWSANRFGAKRMWIIAILCFLFGSMLCGVAWNIGSLIAFRVIQGLGGGLMLPILQTLLLRAAGRDRIGRLMAVVTLPALIGPILGPVIGGLLVGHLSWRWIFYVNAPICILAIVLAIRTLKPDPEPTRAALDVPGLLLISPALAGIIYGSPRSARTAPSATSPSCSRSASA